jgi:hypothetical protein
MPAVQPTACIILPILQFGGVLGTSSACVCSGAEEYDAMRLLEEIDRSYGNYFLAFYLFYDFAGSNI